MEESITSESGDYFFTLYMPLSYFTTSPSEGAREVYEGLCEAMRSISQGESPSIILPSLFDEQGNRLIELVVTPKTNITVVPVTPTTTTPNEEITE